MPTINTPRIPDLILRAINDPEYAACVVLAVNAHAALVEAIDKALHELGIPQHGYPAPVANAVGILQDALAAAEEPHHE